MTSHQSRRQSTNGRNRDPNLVTNLLDRRASCPTLPSSYLIRYDFFRRYFASPLRQVESEVSEWSDDDLRDRLDDLVLSWQEQDVARGDRQHLRSLLHWFCDRAPEDFSKQAAHEIATVRLNVGALRGEGLAWIRSAQEHLTNPVSFDTIRDVAVVGLSCRLYAETLYEDFTTRYDLFFRPVDSEDWSTRELAGLIFGLTLPLTILPNPRPLFPIIRCRWLYASQMCGPSRGTALQQSSRLMCIICFSVLPLGGTPDNTGWILELIILACRIRAFYTIFVCMGSVILPPGEIASSFRNFVKRLCRGFLLSNFRRPNLRRYHDDTSLRQATGRTNATVNQAFAYLFAIGTIMLVQASRTTGRSRSATGLVESKETACGLLQRLLWTLVDVMFPADHSSTNLEWQFLEFCAMCFCLSRFRGMLSQRLAIQRGRL